MGFFDLVGNIFETVAEPVARAALGDYSGAVTSVARQGKPTAQKLENVRSAQMYQQDPGLSQGFSGVTPSTASAGGGGFFGNLGQTIGGFGRDVGGFVQDISPALNLFGIGTQPQRTNAGTATTISTSANAVDIIPYFIKAANSIQLGAAQLAFA